MLTGSSITSGELIPKTCTIFSVVSYEFGGHMSDIEVSVLLGTPKISLSAMDMHEME